ncbi:hypothetical protein AMATHDRAFT_140800 [Amanita thiersii Skay4041]|uniref:FAD dependent oxidoreductase domain-containing protein n=1 Tax=Amanita thiersii Skay4041 TaxID=703135 RepID=A0A2A9NRZ8_9AGAR|nr:hypothetical protein AMATHDRAFT_140800 [Amanita thiersii Skay4041]
MILPEDKIVIVGAGCFGTSTAYHLLKRGFTDITILERSTSLPATDAASNDINKVVRSSYSDEFYSQLARDAISLWKNDLEWANTYHESGVIVLGSTASGELGKAYAHESYQNDVALGARVAELRDGNSIRGVFPPGVRTGSFADREGYLNYDGGWAHAAQGMTMMIEKVKALNGRFVTGKTVCGLVRREDSGRTAGVKCADGSIYKAALVILAVGSWTASAFPEINFEKKCHATGQCIAMIQLTEQESNRYKDCPVVLDLSTGFYIFPPTKEHVVKLAIHGAGYTNNLPIEGYSMHISTPRTVTSDSTRGLAIPKDALQTLRSCLRGVYPDLAEKPLMGTRLCWYNDSLDGDWIIGRYPGDNGLMFATAGSGHAYKFLPVIGRLVADAVQETLDPALVLKFAIDRVYRNVDPSRNGAVLELRLDELCTIEDLAAPNAKED